MPARPRPSRRLWLWLPPLLLLTAALTLPLLGGTVFDEDEAATSISAGARHIGPYSPAEAVAASVARWPDHAWGQAVLFSLWGSIVGWSELAMRALPWLAGLLTLAWVYRIGCELFSTRAGLTAALLLSLSSGFLDWMHFARAYGPALLCSSITLWSYWRVALRPRAAGRGARLALVSSATGLLYLQYFCALLLPALALFHLIYVPRGRRWWHAMLLLGLAGLFALPQAPDLVRGVALNDSREALHQVALDTPQVILLFLRHFSNGLLNPWPQVGELLILALPLPLLIAGRQRLRRQTPDPAWFLALTTILLALLLLGANERMQVLSLARVRYLAALWLPCALLLAGAGWRLQRTGLLAFALLLALAGLHHHLNVSLRPGDDWKTSPVTLAAARAVAAQNHDGVLLVVEEVVLGHRRTRELYLGGFAERRVTLTAETATAEVLARMPAYERVLIFHNPHPRDDGPAGNFPELARQAGWFRCQTTSWSASLQLERFLPPWPPDAARQERLQFGEVASLWLSDEPLLQEDRLRLRAFLRGQGGQRLASWSLAVHIIDPRSGERVAQGDVGVGHDFLGHSPGAAVPLCSEIAIDALPPGEYELRVALYNWQDGARLPARDLLTGAGGDLPALQRFRVG